MPPSLHIGNDLVSIRIGIKRVEGDALVISAWVITPKADAEQLKALVAQTSCAGRLEMPPFTGWRAIAMSRRTATR